VLRYEKRTKRYAPKIEGMINTFTVEQETVEDAVAAVRTLRQTEGIDPEKIFVLGHSLGGMMVPRIAARGFEAAGFIVMAGPARPLEEMVVEQMEYQASLKTPLSAEVEEKLKEVKRQAAAIKALKRGGPENAELLLGGPVSYWLDLQKYDPVTEAAKIKKPLLVLQGEKDCQVNAAVDFAKWKQALSGQPNVTCKQFAGLNHLMMHVEGKSTGEEYAVAGNVAPEVVEEIARWIGAQ